MRRNVSFVLLLATCVVLADSRLWAQETAGAAPPAKTEAAPAKTDAAQGPAEAGQGQTEQGAKAISGITILGNQDAPKSLVIVPWKGSEIGGSIGISTMLDDSRLPIDKEVFMRMLSYYEIRSAPARAGGAPTDRNAAQPATAADRRKR